MWQLLPVESSSISVSSSMSSSLTVDAPPGAPVLILSVGGEKKKPSSVYSQYRFGLEISKQFRTSVRFTLPEVRSPNWVPSLFGPVSVDHVFTFFSGKIPANSRNTHELFSFFKCIVSVRDVQIRQLGKILGGRVKCRKTRSSSRKCLDHMSSKSSTQTLMFPGRVNPLWASEVVKM